MAYKVYEGAREPIISAIPKPIEQAITRLVPGFHSNLVASKEPDNEPIAMQLPKSPNYFASLPKAIVAIVALNSSGLNPKVAKKKVSSINAFKSGLARM